jgi:hypothetical protein
VTQSEYFVWLGQARRVLAASVGIELGPVQVVVSYVWSGNGMQFTLPPADDEEAADGQGWPAEIVTTTPAADPRLRRPHRRILEVLTAEPQTAQRVARLANFRRCNTYVRQALADLVRWGYAAHTPDGYRRAS